MAIKYAILGFLSWKPFTGYELKKIFADALSFHWSGNNNQIYGTLVDLHRTEAVSIEVQQQEKYPARKLYTITDQGRRELRAWLISEPELPILRSIAHIQFAWTEGLDGTELDNLFASYERMIEAQVLMCRETMERGNLEPNRSAREHLIWRSINEYHIAFYENELSWTKTLRTRLKEFA
jgi:PadR family transcriptional regulator, regulatory protein AphA